MFVTSYSVTYCIYIRTRFVLKIVFVSLSITPSHHHHHCANLSEDIVLIKCLSDIFCRVVSKIRHIISVIHYTIRRAVCFQFTHFPCDWENIYTLFHYHHQLGSMNYYPLFKFRSWNNGVRCMSFWILIYIAEINHTAMIFTIKNPHGLAMWGRHFPPLLSSHIYSCHLFLLQDSGKFCHVPSYFSTFLILTWIFWPANWKIYRKYWKSNIKSSFPTI